MDIDPEKTDYALGISNVFFFLSFSISEFKKYTLYGKIRYSK